MILLGRTHGLNTASVPSYKSLMSAQDLCFIIGRASQTCHGRVRGGSLAPHTKPPIRQADWITVAIHL